MSQRALWRALERLLMLACAWFWFGNTGLGLAVLLFAARREPTAAPDPLALLDADVAFAWASGNRILVRCRRQGRLEIFRDEVNPAQWSALKRSIVSAQPATGRSTSI